MPTCTGQALVSAAKCLCLPKKVLRQVMVYLACQWLKKKEPTELISWTPDTEGAFYSTAAVGPFTSVPDLATFRMVDPNTVIRLQVGNNPGNVTAIDHIEGLPNLMRLELQPNFITTLSIVSHLSLTYLDCSNNNLTSLVLTNCSALQTLLCGTCNLGTINITGDFAITTLDFSSNPAVVIIGP